MLETKKLTAYVVQYTDINSIMSVKQYVLAQPVGNDNMIANDNNA